MKPDRPQEVIDAQLRDLDILHKLKGATFFAVAGDGTVFELRKIAIIDSTEVAEVPRDRIYTVLGFKDFGRARDLVTVKSPKVD